MSFWDVLYIFIIWPLRAGIEFIFVFFNRTFKDPGLAILLLSLIVNMVLLPIYTVADRWQEEERDLQKRMKKKLADIRAVFRGDERQMLINTYYRKGEGNPGGDAGILPRHKGHGAPVAPGLPHGTY
jgi:membrane protein insertase Oxa1/YidC/SpoIIIJ